MILAIIICVVGLIIYIRPIDPNRPKVQEVGRIMFWVGLLATLMQSEPYLSKIVLKQ